MRWFIFWGFFSLSWSGFALDQIESSFRLTDSRLVMAQGRWVWSNNQRFDLWWQEAGGARGALTWNQWRLGPLSRQRPLTSFPRWAVDATAAPGSWGLDWGAHEPVEIWLVQHPSSVSAGGLGRYTERSWQIETGWERIWPTTSPPPLEGAWTDYGRLTVQMHQRSWSGRIEGATALPQRGGLGFHGRLEVQAVFSKNQQGGLSVQTDGGAQFSDRPLWQARGFSEIWGWRFEQRCEPNQNQSLVTMSLIGADEEGVFTFSTFWNADVRGEARLWAWFGRWWVQGEADFSLQQGALTEGEWALTIQPPIDAYGYRWRGTGTVKTQGPSYLSCAWSLGAEALDHSLKFALSGKIGNGRLEWIGPENSLSLEVDWRLF